MVFLLMLIGFSFYLTLLRLFIYWCRQEYSLVDVCQGFFNECWWGVFFSWCQLDCFQLNFIMVIFWSML